MYLKLVWIMAIVSRLTRKPIPFGSAVKVSVLEDSVVVSCGANSISIPKHRSVQVSIAENSCSFTLKEGYTSSENLGTVAARFKNAVTDVQNPYSLPAMLVGVGFKAFLSNNGFLVMSLGYSHLVAINIPEDIKVVVKDPTKFEIVGQRDSVSAFFADVKRFKQWDPSLKKGIVCATEFSSLRRKAHKKK